MPSIWLLSQGLNRWGIMSRTKDEVIKELNLSDYKVCSTDETELSTNSADVCGREKNPTKKGDE